MEDPVAPRATVLSWCAQAAESNSPLLSSGGTTTQGRVVPPVQPSTMSRWLMVVRGRDRSNLVTASGPGILSEGSAA